MGDTSSSSVQTGHVMISYQWDNQAVVIKIKDKLKAKGFIVWVDIDDMEGSTLETMAKAVENAKLILLCSSQKYKDSPNCRAGIYVQQFHLN